MLDPTLITKFESLYENSTPVEKYFFAGILNMILQGKEPIMPEIITGKDIVGLGFVTPAVTNKVSAKYSYGQEKYGYTFTLSKTYKVNSKECLADNGKITIQPKQYLLCCSEESWAIPIDVVGFIWPKSSYSRQGLFFQFCPIDPGFKNAQLVFPIFNASDSPIELLCGQGIAQAVFFRGVENGEPSYDGGYSNRNGVVEFKG